MFYWSGTKSQSQKLFDFHSLNPFFYSELLIEFGENFSFVFTLVFNYETHVTFLIFIINLETMDRIYPSIMGNLNLKPIVPFGHYEWNMLVPH